MSPHRARSRRAAPNAAAEPNATPVESAFAEAAAPVEPSPEMPAEFLRIPVRRITVQSPTIQLALGPGDRVLVATGQRVEAGTPIAEITLDAEPIDAGRLGGDSNGNGRTATRSPIAPTPAVPVSSERRRPPEPGKWWVGGDDRRGKANLREPPRRVAGTLLYELGGRWVAAAGDQHEQVLAPASGVVTAAVSCIGVSIKLDGVAISGLVAGGQPARGHLDVPKLVDGELRDTAFDVGRSGAIVVAGGRISTETIVRAKAMSIHGIVAGSAGQAELRDLAASEARQRSAFHLGEPFAVLGLDGHQRRPIPSPVVAILSALAGREVAIVTDPPLLVLGVASVSLPKLPPDWIRVRSGPDAGREGRWLRPAGLYRFRAGIHLEAAEVRLGEDAATTIVPIADLERLSP